MKKYILSIDSGTTGVTVLLVDKKLNVVKKTYSELKQYYPQPGWVEHDPEELIQKIKKLIHKAVKDYSVNDIASIGITNQRETVVVWDKNTGKAIYNAIVWQCRRTEKYCKELGKHKKTVFNKTGLYIDSYFSATKIKWILDNVKNIQSMIDKKNLCAGTIDTWIIWNLTKGESHLTDHTNASRTMLFNIENKNWDNYLLSLFNIPKNILPKVKNSMDDFGLATIKGVQIPIQGVAGDQQAALFGQGCLTNGSSKCTYGTGLFYLLNTGKKRINSNNGLLTTLASDKNGKPVYAIEGSVFIGGAVIQWIRDELKLIKKASESEDIALSINDTQGVYIVPAFVGLGAPYWNSESRGIITGLTRGTNTKHIIRAALESIAYQVNDLLKSIKKDTKKSLKMLNVDGGATSNKFLLQFQADVSNITIIKPFNIESTALGSAILAGVQSSFWKDTEEAFKYKKNDSVYTPEITKSRREKLIKGWELSIEKVNR